MAQRGSSSRGKGGSSSGKKFSILSSVVKLVEKAEYAPVPRSGEQWRRLIGWGLVVFSVLAIIASVSYFFAGPADQSIVEGGIVETNEAQNSGGRAGAWVAEVLVRQGFGIMAIPVLLYAAFIGLTLIEGDYYVYIRKLFKYVAFSVVFISVFMAYIVWISGGNPDYGGMFGYTIVAWGVHLVGKFGTGLLLLFALIAWLTLNFNAEIKASTGLEKVKVLSKMVMKGEMPQIKIPLGNKPIDSPSETTDAAGNPLTEVLKKARRAKEMPANRGIEEDDGLPFTPDPPRPGEQPIIILPARPANAGKEASTTGNKDTGSKSRSLAKTDEDATFMEISLPTGGPRLREGDMPRKDGQLEFVVEQNADDEGDGSDLKEYIPLGDDNVGIVKGQGTVEKIVEAESQELDEDMANALEDWTEFDPTLELSEFIHPSWGMLESHGSTGEPKEVDMQELEDNKNRIVQTLLDYKIEIVKITATIGPTVTLYEIVPAPGVRISKIRSLEDDIALNLAALGIRIIAPIPGKGTIGIEVPNSKPEVVSLRSVLMTQKFAQSKMGLPIALGKTIDNKVFIGDLSKMPHLLIAGATGQGKSVGLNTIIASILFKRHPGEVKFVLIDPKKVEMSLYQPLHHHFLAQMPHQMDPIITDTREAVNVLKCLCVEMDMRYDLLKKGRVRNLAEYNEKFKKRQLNPRNGHFFMPYIVLVIDELADLMMTAGKEVEMPIARLAQLARAVGIHLVVATQRPSVNVITGIIKANFPARLSYRVTSKVDSRTILDHNGADQLIGRGDMLLSTGNDLTRIQNAFIDTPEVERLVEFIASQRGYHEPYMLPDVPKDDKDGKDDDDDDDEPVEIDSMFKEAARLIVRYQIGSASLIQRKMKLGYNRAGRIIDQMERVGIVGAHNGSKSREVLYKDENELENLLSSLSR